jgi:TonB-linked SusC/RagA family outer membrane protein
MKKVLLCTQLCLLILLLDYHPVFAQEKLIRGQVISVADGTGLPIATIVELDKNNRIVKGTSSDIDGNFAIKVSDTGHRLQVSFIGYKSVTLDIGNRSNLVVRLEEEIKSLEAVEIVAERRINTGFLDVKSRDLAIPVEKIDMKEVEEVQASSIDEALQGRLAGVDIVSNSGDPGSGMSIRIRGVSSLRTNSDPLIVIDNVPYDISVSPDFNFATANEEGYAQMLNISLDDIREITVMKDAAATALWGTKASNGVLFITTKRGTKGMRPDLSFTYRGTYSFEPRTIPMLNGDQYSTLIFEGTMNVDGIPLNTNEYKEFQYDPSDPYWYYNYSQNTNWLDEISRDGYIHNYDLSLTGGGEKAFYRFSSNYQKEQGVTLGTDMNRLTTRLNLDYNISDKLMMRADLSYAHGISNSSYDKYIRSTAYKKMPNMSVYEYDQSGNRTPVYFSPEQNIQGMYKNTYNPVAMAEYGMYKTTTDRIITKFNTTYNIIRDLKYTLDIAFDLNNTKRNWFLPQIATGLSSTRTYVNRARDRDEDSYNIYINNKLTYHKNINDVHDIILTLNYQSNDYRGLSYESETSNSASSELADPSIPANINTEGLGLSSGSWQVRNVGLLGLVHYSLLDRYIISGGVRREGNSKFNEKYRYGYFPSISLAWRISGEPFMLRFTFLDDLRLRASYGENGHSPKDAYTYFNNYETFSWTYLGNTAVYSADMELENLKWESFITKNIGISLEIFNGRLMLDYDMYQNSTKDMLEEKVTLPSSSGYNTTTMNIGSLDNQGWDFSFRSFPVRHDGFSISFDFNIARNYNVLREVAKNYATERGETTSNGEFKHIIQTDNPIGSFYGYRYLGVYKDEEDLIAVDAAGNKVYNANGDPVMMVFNYPSVNYEFQPGDAKYDDINHDGNINYLDVVYLGDANPDFTGGFGSTVSYKDFSFNFFFYGRYGNDIINMTQMYGENMYNYDNQTTAVLRRWRKPGDETNIPRALTSYGYNWLGSSRFVDDGSFLRLKYITLSYRFPSKLIGRLGIKSMRISTTINNLLTFTPYKGQDPEITIKPIEGTLYTVGYDYSQTPVTKQVTFNLNVVF